MFYFGAQIATVDDAQTILVRFLDCAKRQFCFATGLGLAAFALAAVGPAPNAQAGGNPNTATAEWTWEKYGRLYYPDTRQGALEWLARHHLANVDSDDSRWRYLPFDLTRPEVDNYARHSNLADGGAGKTGISLWNNYVKGVYYPDTRDGALQWLSTNKWNEIKNNNHNFQDRYLPWGLTRADVLKYKSQR